MSQPLAGTIVQRLRQNLEFEIQSAKLLTGGDVSGALLVTATSGKQLIVKQNATASAGMFAAEADGLHRLGASGDIQVPEVYTVHDTSEDAPQDRFIAMEYRPADAEDSVFGRTAQFGRSFGAQLAALHHSNPSPNNQYGLELPSFLGRRPLNNNWSSSWADFYRDQRIYPVLPQCRVPLGDQLYQRAQKLCGAIPDLLSAIPHTPCLIHGDLWSGNYLVSAKAPVLIDPAAYYGHPEHEWAYMELFGGFPSAMRRGYDSIAPLDPGYEQRRPLLQLFHILVHVAHFGRPYVPAVEHVCSAYGF